MDGVEIETAAASGENLGAWAEPAGADDVVIAGSVGEEIGGGSEGLMSEVPAGQTGEAAAGAAQQLPGQAAAQPAVEAPAEWPSDHRAQFGKLPPPMQQFFMDRHKAMEAAHTRRSQDIAPLRNLEQQWRPHLQAIGAQLPQVANQAMEFDYAMRSAASNDQKLDVLINLGRQYGVDFNGGGAAGGGQWNDENDKFGVARQVQEMQQPIVQQLRQFGDQLGRIQTQGTTFQQAQAQRELARAEQLVSEFQNRKDAKGNLAHPFYADVEQDMKVLAQAWKASGRPLDISELYKQACWMNPAVRTKMQRGVQASSAAAGPTGAAVGAAGGLAGGGGAVGAQASENLSTEDFLKELWPKS